MKSLNTKISIFLLVFFFFTVLSFSGLRDKKEDYIAQASLFDIIRALVTINPLEVVVSAPPLVEINKMFKVEARVINKGEERIKRTSAEIFLPQGLVLTKKNTVQNAGAISGLREKRIQWSVKAEQTGNYFISVSSSAELKGDTITAQGNTVMVVAQEGAVSASSVQSVDFFQRLLNTFQRLLGL